IRIVPGDGCRGPGYVGSVAVFIVGRILAAGPGSRNAVDAPPDVDIEVGIVQINARVEHPQGSGRAGGILDDRAVAVLRQYPRDAPWNDLAATGTVAAATAARGARRFCADAEDVASIDA